MTEQNQPAPKPQKKKKPKGPVRTGVIVPLIVIVALIYIYFHFFFDMQMRRALEWGGYTALGAEVNVGNFETSFFSASLRIQNIQVTNSEKPTHNSVVIGDIRWGMLWDALLRGKVVVNEAVIEQIELDTVRKYPGRVKPPEPPPVDDGKPSFLETEGKKIGDKATGQVEKQAGTDNVLADAIAMMGGGANFNDQLKSLEGTLTTKKKAQEADDFIKKKQAEWSQKMKSLPQGSELQALNDRLGKVKYKDFKSPDELQTSLKEFDSIFKEADQKIKQVQGTTQDFNDDMKALDTQIKDLQSSFQADMKNLEGHFRIPKIDAASIAKSIFMGYLQPYLTKFENYKRIVQKYMPYVPPNLLKKKDKGEQEEDMALQPHKRARGTTYEFGKPNSYPLVWIKKTGISSESKNNPQAGELKGYITDISTNQALIKKPLVASLTGSFPGLEISDFKSEITIDHRTTDHKELFKVGVGSYPLVEKTFVDSPDVKIGFKKARGSLDLNGVFNNDGLAFKLTNRFTQIAYEVGSKNETVDQILKNVFQGISVVSLDAEGKGHLPNIPLSINSNLGDELRRGFEKQIQAKIDEARDKLKKYIDDAVGKEKAKVEAEAKKFQDQINGELAKVNTMVNKSKSDAEGKANQAKKDLEEQGNRARKEAEDKAKKQGEDELKKKAEEMKKKLGF